MWTFAQVTTFDTQLYARLPDSMRFQKHEAKTDRRRRNFLEGPSFDHDGNLYCVDIPCGRIYRISPSRSWEIVADYDGQPNGLKIHRDGRLFVADRVRGIVVVDPRTGVVETAVSGPRSGEKFKGPNDLVFDHEGNLYFTDQGGTGLQDSTGCVYRFTKKGSLECMLDNVPSPNGIVVNRSGSGLYVAVTRANQVWRMDLTHSSRRTGLFCQTPSAGPDGLALDGLGNVYVALPGAGVIWIYSKWGELLHGVKSCAGEMTVNVSFGGEDRRKLFITESKENQILVADLPYAGLPMYSHWVDPDAT